MFIQDKYIEEISEKAKSLRRFETKDLAKRLAVITSRRVFIENYPEKTPKTVFNPSLKIMPDGLRIFARISVGYYTYTSGIVEFDIPFDDLDIKCDKIYSGKLTIIPDNRFDFWGVEDPRFYTLDGNEFITYSGRTVNYFQTHIRVERTLPVTAVRDGEKWKKIAVFRMPPEIRSFVVSDKNAFLVKGESLMLFHRLHMLNEKFYLNICRIPEQIIKGDGLREVTVGEHITIMEHCDFESKIGWGTPPIRINDDYLVFLHGVDNRLSVYRVFAALINSHGHFSAITPFYIMEPREVYEIYGDRPYVVFPCGAGILNDKIYLSYGGADSVIGIAEMDLGELMNVLEANRL